MPIENIRRSPARTAGHDGANPQTNLAGAMHQAMMPHTLNERFERQCRRANHAHTQMQKILTLSALKATYMQIKAHQVMRGPFACLDTLLGTRTHDDRMADQDNPVNGRLMRNIWTCLLISPNMTCLVAMTCTGIAVGLSLARRHAHTGWQAGFYQNLMYVYMPFEVVCGQFFGLLNVLLKGLVMGVAAAAGAVIGALTAIFSNRPFAQRDEILRESPVMHPDGADARQHDSVDKIDASNCINDTDLYLTRNVNEIEKQFFIRLEDNYGFDVRQLITYLTLRQKVSVHRLQFDNPYTRRCLSENDCRRILARPEAFDLDVDPKKWTFYSAVFNRRIWSSYMTGLR